MSNDTRSTLTDEKLAMIVYTALYRKTIPKITVQDKLTIPENYLASVKALLNQSENNSNSDIFPTSLDCQITSIEDKIKAAKLIIAAQGEGGSSHCGIFSEMPSLVLRFLKYSNYSLDYLLENLSYDPSRDFLAMYQSSELSTTLPRPHFSCQLVSDSETNSATFVLSQESSALYVGKTDENGVDEKLIVNRDNNTRFIYSRKEPGKINIQIIAPEKVTNAKLDDHNGCRLNFMRPNTNEYESLSILERLFPSYKNFLETPEQIKIEEYFQYL